MGIPGVGKSTIFRRLMALRSARKPEFLSCDELVRPPRWAGSSALLRDKTVKVLISKNHWLARVLYRRPDDCEISNGFQKLDANFRTFVQHCLNTEAGDFLYPEYQVMGFAWLAQVIEIYAALGRIALPEEVVMIEEGMAQKVHSIIPLETKFNSRRQTYFELMPRPAAIVFLRAPIDVVMRRILARRREGGRLLLLPRDVR